MKFLSRIILPSVLISALCFPPAESFAATEVNANNADTAQLIRLLNEQNKRLEAQEKAMAEQAARFKALEAQINGLDAAKAAPSTAANETKKVKRVVRKAVAKPDAKSAKNTSSDEPKTVGLDRKPQEQDRPPMIEAVRDEGGVLLRPGQVVVTPSFDYSRSSALSLAVEGFTIIPALNVGSFDISSVDRDTFTSAISARAGLFKGVEIEARVPYIFRNDSSLSRPLGIGAAADILTDVDGSGLGDIEVAAHYQLPRWNWNRDWPFLVANMRFKSTTGTDPFEVPTDSRTGLQLELPTGSGFYAFQPSITAIFPTDPVVLYGNVGYLFNVGRNFGGTLGELDPGDSVSVSMGMGFSANEKMSFSIGYNHSMVMETTQNGVPLTNSDVLQVGVLNFGVGYRVSERTSINVGVDAGLTDDAPDMRFVFRVPVAFSLF